MKLTTSLTLALALVIGVSIAAARSQMQGSAAEPTNQTIQGCLTHSASGYFLTATGADQRRYERYEITGDTSALAKHVGHTMSVTGEVSQQAVSTSGGVAAQAGTIVMQDFHHISANCRLTRAPASAY